MKQTVNKRIHNVSICVFHDSRGNIALQERGSHSKTGEKLGFWGGGIEKGETKEDAISRELEEELGYVPENLTFWGTYSYEIDDIKKYMGMKVFINVFVSPLTEQVKSTKPLEGDAVVVMRIDKAIEDDGLYKGDRGLLKKLKRWRVVGV